MTRSMTSMFGSMMDHHG